jgi:uncharacterized protein
MRVVIDTNVWVSYLLNRHSSLGNHVFLLMNEAEILLSDALYRELEDVLQRSKIMRYVPQNEAQQFLQHLRELGEWVKPKIQITACRDPQDNHLLELAIAGKADMILTGDADLLVLHPFQGVKIVCPAQR